VTEVRLQIEGDVSVVLIDNPPVNALSQAVREGVMRELAVAGADDGVRAIVLACEGRTFCAGADISEFDAPPQPPTFRELIAAVEACPKPVVAALFGTVLGGGLELALGCHYRVALKGTRLGLPEVNLGIIPGAGGTQRLPRVIGLEAALDMIPSGRPIDAAKAHELGLVDRLIGDDLMASALEFASEMGAERKLPPPMALRTVASDGSGELFAAAREAVAGKMRGQIAPQGAIDALEAAVELPLEDGLLRERAIFDELIDGNQSKALRHMFFAERQAAKVPGLPAKPKLREIASVGVVGGGTMGRGITMAMANAGLPVTMVEVSGEALDAAKLAMAEVYGASLERGRISEDQMSERLGRITGATDYVALGDCDLVIEAVFEEIEIKKKVFESLDAVAKPGAILASNTSYLDIDQIADFTKRPGDVLGMHFFSPAHIMRLLEIVRGDKTDGQVLATVLNLAKRIGKIGVVSGVCHGFIGNRLLQGYIREAGLLMLEGAAPQHIDKALYDFGMAMGVLAVMDLAGLDIGYTSRKESDPNEMDPHAFLVFDRLVELGRKGQKTGAGIYHYEPGSRRPLPEPLVDQLIEATAAELGIERRKISDNEIVERCVYAIVNEGAKVIEEGIAYRASDIDVVYVNGYGFPRYRGGPMFYADQVGLTKVRDAIRDLAGIHGPRWWTPAPLLESLAKSGGTFNA